uniref:Uncharacterized protein n=1 Tax=Anguilla anguilla TaxID=7936 RepID=A0A0E9UKL0_ANGAN
MKSQWLGSDTLMTVIPINLSMMSLCC